MRLDRQERHTIGRWLANAIKQIDNEEDMDAPVTISWCDENDATWKTVVVDGSGRCVIHEYSGHAGESCEVVLAFYNNRPSELRLVRRCFKSGIGLDGVIVKLDPKIQDVVDLIAIMK
jgi:hypothetical protein